MEELELRNIVLETGPELLREGLVARTWGNISARVDDTHYLITPSGMDYERLTPDDLVLCDRVSGKVSGKNRPSSERGVHAIAYELFPEVNFVIHTHQVYATALGLAGYQRGSFTGDERVRLGGFITLTDIEGSDLQLSQNVLYSMNYIAHEGTLLDPESWYFQQCATFGENDSPSDVPNLEITITRYPLNMLAEMRVAELSRQKFDNSGDYQKLDVLDECLYAKREGWTHTSEITGETRTFLPGGILVLRRGNTVLFANYYGEHDLSEHIEHFVQMLENL